MRRGIFLIMLILLSQILAAQVSIRTDISQQGTPMSKYLIGAFFEDINYGADGGLYAELVQNRSFEYYVVPGYTSEEALAHWQLIKKGVASGTMALSNAEPLNTSNVNYLKLDISNGGNGIGISNAGFDGIPVQSGEKYFFSVYLRSQGDFSEDVIVSIKSATYGVVGIDTIKGISKQWEKYELEITANATVTDATLDILTKGTGTLCFDIVSLFPEQTFMKRRNGLRKDLAQAIADLQPKFLRFPGGCISHGRGINNAYRWKESLGDVSSRKPNWNLWGYHQTYGLGFYEYFLFCEDIGAMPLPVVPVGVSCQFRNREIVPLSEMQPWIDDAVDLIEFANGPVDSEWGSVRAEMGHPEPFNMEYICLGNEEDDIPEFRERFTLISNAIHNAYPGIKIIGTSGTAASGGYYDSLWEFSRQEGLDAVDEHYYVDPSWFLNNLHRYDNFDRNGPKVFIGEYASWNDLMYNAIAEAAYLTGVERNSDIVEFTCYAPLLCHVNHSQWNPDLIRFDKTELSLTANYYVQQMYSLNAGDEYLKSSVEYGADFSGVKTFKGKAGVATWATQAVFDDFKVTSGDKVWIDQNFTSIPSDWDAIAGTFNLAGGSYSQTSGLTPAWSICNTVIDTTNYTISLKAMKTGGAEGFLIPFSFENSENYYWLNLGGWNNSTHAIEKCVNGRKSTLVANSGSIPTNVWMDIRIEIAGYGAAIYLNNDLLFNIPVPQGPVATSVSKDLEKNQLIVKLVNTSEYPITAEISLDNAQVAPTGTVTTLQGQPSWRNEVGAREMLAPLERSIDASSHFNYILPGTSFQVLRLDVGATSVNSPVKDENNTNASISIYPNPASGKVKIWYPYEGFEACTLNLYDLSGNKVRTEIFGTNKRIELDRGTLKSGLYLVEIIGETKRLNGKLIYTDK